VKRANPAWNIEDLRLRLPHMSAADARWVAHEIASRLSAIPAPPRQIGALDLHLTPEPQAGRERMVALIVQSIVRSCG
jgi:hypothetical protein